MAQRLRGEGHCGFGFLLGCILLTISMVAPDTARVTCDRQCDASYSSDVDDCRLQHGDDPADADELTNCIQEAKDNYRSCLYDCTTRAISLPPWYFFVASASTISGDQPVRVRRVSEPSNSGLLFAWVGMP